MIDSSHAVVLDFDGTCTRKSAGSLFKIMDESGGLNPECLQKARDLRSHYFSRAHDAKLKLNEKDTYDWFSKTMDLYLESGLTMAKIREIMSQVQLRSGLKDCLRLLEERDVPVAIISYGVHQFIEEALRANQVLHLVSEIYAAKLKINSESGLVTSFYPNTAVFPYNKGGFSRIFAKKHDVPLHRILAVGDSGGDAELGHLKENRLGLAADNKEKKTLKQYMGEVIVAESFVPAQFWLLRKIDSVGADCGR